MLMNERRCVITGLGLVSAIGHNTEECFNAALNGISGIKDVKASILPTAIRIREQR